MVYLCMGLIYRFCSLSSLCVFSPVQRLNQFTDSYKIGGERYVIVGHLGTVHVNNINGKSITNIQTFEVEGTVGIVK